MSDEFNNKWKEENGDIVQMRFRDVPPSPSHPNGIVYSLVCIRNGKRLIGYDNENHGSGKSNHHRHIKNRIAPYHYIDKWTLLADFADDLQKIRRGVIE